YAGCQVNVPPLDPHEQRRIACFRPLIGEVKT
ncbi:unnamed protein product, partial [marine sediment metagenome]